MNESLVEFGSLFFSKPATAIAGQVDSLFTFILWVSILLFLLVFGAAAVFVYKYRSKGNTVIPKQQWIHDNRFELLWTVVPFILVMIVFVWGFKDFFLLRVSPSYSYEISVTGKKWFWVFDYPDTGKTVMNDLVVPVNQPIKLIMASEDVLHSFYIPNMRIKRDVIPNRYTTLTFTADRVGEFTIFCTEYCGDGHSAMLANLKVVSKDDFEEWKQTGGASDDMPLADLGKKLYADKMCNTCHSLDGSPMSGPSWKGLYQANRELSDGSVVVADENYLRESIVYPKARVVAGYQPVMPAYAGLLSDREISALIEYIKEIK
ncbi:MAG: cytochrome c oxidase subunit II [bacterium]|nr:cytochrome c oxidase subunit II [bacterium]